MWKKIVKFFERFDEKSWAHRYLSESYDHVDLERRMQELDRRKIRWY